MVVGNAPVDELTGLGQVAARRGLLAEGHFLLGAGQGDAAELVEQLGLRSLVAGALGQPQAALQNVLRTVELTPVEKESPGLLVAEQQADLVAGLLLAPDRLLVELAGRVEVALAGIDP